MQICGDRDSRLNNTVVPERPGAVTRMAFRLSVSAKYPIAIGQNGPGLREADRHPINQMQRQWRRNVPLEAVSAFAINSEVSQIGPEDIAAQAARPLAVDIDDDVHNPVRRFGIRSPAADEVGLNPPDMSHQHARLSLAIA